MSKILAQAIVNYINTDIEINAKIGSDRVFLLHTTDISKPSLVYSIKPIEGGIIKQGQLEIKVIWPNAELVLDIEELLDAKFDLKDKEPSKLLLNNVVFRSKRAGGGLLFNENLKTYENTLIYIFKWRCKGNG